MMLAFGTHLGCFMVMGVTALSLALLLPAVNKVHKAAARMVCQNNLRQLGLSALNLHDSQSHFPTGTMPNAALAPDERLSLHVSLLPYIASDPLYRQLKKDEPWNSPSNSTALEGVEWKTYHCPAWKFGATPEQHTGPLAITNYVGVAGVGPDAATRSAGAPGNGVFGYDRTTKKDDITDGLANTALFFETAHELGPWARGGPGTVRALIPDAPTFGGNHKREQNVLLADGSVRVLKDAAPTVLAALATIAGGEEVNAGW